MPTARAVCIPRHSVGPDCLGKYTPLRAIWPGMLCRRPHCLPRWGQSSLITRRSHARPAGHQAARVAAAPANAAAAARAPRAAASVGAADAPACAEFRRLAGEAGVDTSYVTLAESGGPSGRSLVAVRDAPKGCVLLAVPRWAPARCRGFCACAKAKAADVQSGFSRYRGCAVCASCVAHGCAHVCTHMLSHTDVCAHTAMY